MDATSDNDSRTRTSIWDGFLRVLQQRRTPARQARWYVRRAEAFLKACPRDSLGTYTAQDIIAYLEAAGRRPALADWQYRQLVEALEILFAHVLKLPWARGFDWSFWRDCSRQLEPDHATIARAPLDPEAEEVTAATDTGYSSPDGIFGLVIAEIRRRAYSIRTEQAYVHWIRRFVTVFGGRDPTHLGPAEVKIFLERLVVRRNVSVSTQNQALSALIFLYREVLKRPLELDSFARAKRPRHLPVVLTRAEVDSLLASLSGTSRLMASLLYGTGMRLMEVVRLRVKDIDFGYRQIIVRNAKGAKDRVVPLPEVLIDPLRTHLAAVRELFKDDLSNGFGSVYLPDALAKKYPNAHREWI